MAAETSSNRLKRTHSQLTPEPSSQSSAPPFKSVADSSENTFNVDPPAKRLDLKDDSKNSAKDEKSTAVTFPLRRKVHLSDHPWIPASRDQIRDELNGHSPWKLLEKLVTKGGNKKSLKSGWFEPPKGKERDTNGRYYEVMFCRPDRPGDLQRLRLFGSNFQFQSFYVLAVAELLYVPFPAPSQYSVRQMYQEARVLLSLPPPNFIKILDSIRVLANNAKGDSYYVFRKKLINGVAGVLKMPSPYDVALQNDKNSHSTSTSATSSSNAALPIQSLDKNSALSKDASSSITPPTDASNSTKEASSSATQVTPSTPSKSPESPTKATQNAITAIPKATASTSTPKEASTPSSSNNPPKPPKATVTPSTPSKMPTTPTKATPYATVNKSTQSTATSTPTSVPTPAKSTSAASTSKSNAPTPSTNVKTATPQSTAKETSSSQSAKSTSFAPTPTTSNIDQPKTLALLPSLNKESSAASTAPLNESFVMEIDPPLEETEDAPTPIITTMATNQSNSAGENGATAHPEAKNDVAVKPPRKQPQWVSLLDPIIKTSPTTELERKYVTYDCDDILPCDFKLWEQWRESFTQPSFNVESRALTLLKSLHEHGSFVSNEMKTILISEELYLLWVLHKSHISRLLRDCLYEDQELIGLEVVRLRLLYACSPYLIPKFLHLILQSVAAVPDARKAASDLFDDFFLPHVAGTALWAASTLDKLETCEIVLYSCRLFEFVLEVLPDIERSEHGFDVLAKACKILSEALKGEKYEWLENAIQLFSKASS